MKALTLKRKYPNFWNYVEQEVKNDMLDCMPQSMVAMHKEGDENCRIKRVAHNAAFFATLKYHEWECCCTKQGAISQ